MKERSTRNADSRHRLQISSSTLLRVYAIHTHILYYGIGVTCETQRAHKSHPSHPCVASGGRFNHTLAKYDPGKLESAVISDHAPSTLSVLQWGRERVS